MLYCGLDETTKWGLRALICAISYGLAVGGGHLLVKGVLRGFEGPDGGQGGGLKNAGAVIGILERAVTLTLILVGEYTTVGLVLTGKSVARFEELKKREFAEYYLIGTLASVFAAIVVGILARYALSAVAQRCLFSVLGA